jgi:hypothetical protein
MKTSLRLLSLFAFAATSLFAQENYGQWAKYRTLTVNTTAGGANTSGNVRGFPLLVRLTSAQADVFAQAKAGGADLRFTKDNGTTRLSHEIEQWDSAGQSASIWVRLDTAYANNSTQSLRVYWGRPAAADSSQGAGVFRTSENYQGVWHLAGMNDATVNANNGTNNATTDTAGAVGRGRHFNGTSAYINVGNSAAMNSSVPFTIEGWVSWQSIGTSTIERYRPLMTHGTSGSNGNQVFLQPRRPSSGGTNPYYSFGYYTGSSQTAVTNDAQAPALSDSGVWVHVTGAYDGTNWNVYRNGVLAASVARAGTIANATTNWFIGGGDGNGATTPSRFYFGKMDEVRFSDAARDSNWVRLSYETQKAGATAVTVGTTQSTAGPAAITSLAYGDSAKAADTIVVDVGLPFNRVPTYLGGPVDSIKVVAGSLPAGLTVNKASGALSGTATAATAAANVTIRAWGHFAAGDSVSRTVRVSSVVGVLANLHYSPDTSTLTVGVPVSRMPTYTGRAPTKFKASGLPAGLSLDSVSGLLSGTPTAAAAAANYTVTATNTAGPDTATRVLRFTVVAEDYATWTQRDTLWLNTTAGNGAGTSATVTNFPVLVRLDSTAFASVYTQSIGRGADLRFLKGLTNVRLPHQIESWDSTGRKAAIWVLVDSVKPADRTQTIRMLWGKAGAPDLSSGPSVFDTAKGYVGVWHLSGTGDAADATANGFTAANTGSPASVAGLLGPGRSFDGTSQYFIVAHNAKLNITQNLTISAWVNANDWEGSRYIVAKATGMNANSQYGLRDNSTGGLILETANTSAGIRMDNPSAAAWHLITGTYGGGFGRIYLDGSLVTSVASAADLSTTTQTVGIGRRNTGAGADHWFAGLMDEVRIQNALRDSNWIRMEYHNQKAAQSLVWLSQPPIVLGIGGSSVARHDASGFSVKAAGAGLLFRLQGAQEGKATLALMDMWGRTVWSGAFASGASELAWDGRGSAGSAVSAGVYAARVTVFDKQGKAVQVMDKKVPYTR